VSGKLATIGGRARFSVEALLERAIKYEAALRAIAELPKTHEGATDEELWNDMEDAFSNGVDVGTYESYVEAANIAKEALK